MHADEASIRFAFLAANSVTGTETSMNTASQNGWPSAMTGRDRAHAGVPVQTSARLTSATTDQSATGSIAQYGIISQTFSRCAAAEGALLFGDGDEQEDERQHDDRAGGPADQRGGGGGFEAVAPRPEGTPIRHGEPHQCRGAEQEPPDEPALDGRQRRHVQRRVGKRPRRPRQPRHARYRAVGPRVTGEMGDGLLGHRPLAPAVSRSPA